MFYNHEILTSRKYGVATVWIVATLGSRSNLSKKVTRKDILQVDVSKACGTIIEPEVPMALRLQSNLLYGVSRVYDQQCQYVLKDAQHAQDHMRQMLKVVKNSDLDLEAGKATRPEHLLLQDDPNFMPDLAFTNLAMDLDFNLAAPDLISDHGSSQSSMLLSPHNLRMSPAPSIHIPTSGNDFYGGIGGLGGFSGDDESRGRLSSLAPGSISRLAINDGTGFLADPGIELDLDIGDLVTIDVADQTARASNKDETPLQRAGSEMSATERVVRDLQEADTRNNNYNDDDQALPQLYDDDEGLLPLGARPFSPRIHDQEEARDQSCSAHPDNQDEEYAEAPARRARILKPLQADTTVELSNTDLRNWDHNYLQNMAKAIAAKAQSKANAQAKKNADFWIWQMGIAGLGRMAAVAPGLEMFRGVGFVDALLGLRGQKRDHAAIADETEEGRRVRSRTESPRADEVGRGDVDDLGLAPVPEDDRYDDIEIGRNAPTPLPAENLADMSLAMPWNVSASQRFSTLQHLRPSRAGSISSALPPHGRLTSASPLLGRGATLPDRLSRQGSLALGPAGAPTSSVGGVDFDLGGYGIDADVSMHDADAPMNTEDRFELLGPAANVDTQEAGTSQWMRAVLDTESGNFLDFVEAEIERRKDDGGDVIEFETLLPPEMNTAVVAAQGLLHCLALATKGLLSVKQEEDFGDIVLGLMGRQEVSFVGK